MAEIHRDLLKDYTRAREFYEQASKSAIKVYKSMYGDAYPLVLNQKYIPKLHYKLYRDLADIHLREGNPEQTLKVVEWNLSMWPDSASNYIIAAKGNWELGNQEKACDFATIARLLGYEGQEPSIYCLGN